MATRQRRKPALQEVAVAVPPHVARLLGGEAAALKEAMERTPPVSVRYNPAKAGEMPGRPVPWCRTGRYLHQRPVFTLDPLLHGGAYYVQEASSMLLEQAVGAFAPLATEGVALDLCAAPGGKSTHLAALLPEGWLLVANEPVRARQPALIENLRKWGRPGVVITGADPGRLAQMGPFCDLIIVDAPCSGEGMFRKDPYARQQWTEGLVANCALRQSDILQKAWAMLKPGGALVYSTCTWETAENEDQVRLLLSWGATAVDIPTEGAWGIEKNALGLRCYPHKVQGEGFFVAAVRKPGAASASVPWSSAPVWPQAVAQWLRQPEAALPLELDGTLYAVPMQWYTTVGAMLKAGVVLAPGSPVALQKAAQWQPHPAFALDRWCDQGNFQPVGLNKEQALNFLRGGSLPAVGAQGPALARYEGLALGWLNGAGNRWNNWWPVPWRIRMR